MTGKQGKHPLVRCPLLARQEEKWNSGNLPSREGNSRILCVTALNEIVPSIYSKCSLTAHERCWKRPAIMEESLPHLVSLSKSPPRQSLFGFAAEVLGDPFPHIEPSNHRTGAAKIEKSDSQFLVVELASQFPQFFFEHLLASRSFLQRRHRFRVSLCPKIS